MFIPPGPWSEIIKQIVQRLFVVVFYVNTNKKPKGKRARKPKKNNSKKQNSTGAEQ